MVGPPMTWEDYPLACKALSLSPLSFSALDKAGKDAAKRLLDTLNVLAAWAQFDTLSPTKGGIFPASTGYNILGSSLTDSHDIWSREDGGYSLLRAYDCLPQERHQRMVPKALDKGSKTSDVSFGRRLPIAYARRDFWGRPKNGRYPVIDGPLLIGDGLNKVFYGLCIDDKGVSGMEAEAALKALSWKPLKIKTRKEIGKVDYGLRWIKRKPVVKAPDSIKEASTMSSKTKVPLTIPSTTPKKSTLLEIFRVKKAEIVPPSLGKGTVGTSPILGPSTTRRSEVTLSTSSQSKALPTSPKGMAPSTTKITQSIDEPGAYREYIISMTDSDGESLPLEKIPIERRLAPKIEAPSRMKEPHSIFGDDDTVDDGEYDFVKWGEEEEVGTLGELVTPNQKSGLKRVPTQNRIRLF